MQQPQNPLLGPQPDTNNGCGGCLVTAAIVFSVVLTLLVIVLVLKGLR